MKYSFGACRRIQEIPEDLFQQGYKFVSFDVESLFTSVPLEKTLYIILDRVYKEKLVTTALRKRTLKKLIPDSCKKTAFSFNCNLYEQVDGVSRGSSLGPVLANIIMTELEQMVIDKFISDGVIKFCVRYVDDTLGWGKLTNIIGPTM